MRTRIVLTNRQILASDVNEITANQIYNQKVVNDGIIGISKGVVSGLDTTSIANTSTIFYIPSGIVCDGEGTFYELLSTSAITMSGGSGTYKAYVQYCTINDTPISGYTLLDVSTRTESFTTVNTRTYDGLTGNVTTGAVASNAEHIANIVWNGSAITSVTDVRSLVTFASLPAYTLQGLTVGAVGDYAYRSDKITGNIIDETDTNAVRWLKGLINNAHAGVFTDINIGDNSGAIGSLITASGNIGYKLVSLFGGSGYVSAGTSNTGFGYTASNHQTGFLSSSSTVGYKSNILTSSTGFVGQGVSNVGIGSAYSGLESAIVSQNCSNILNSTVVSNQFGIILNTSSSATGILLNATTAGSTPFKLNSLLQTTSDVAHSINISGNVLTNFGSYISVKGTGIGKYIEHTSGSNQFYGLYITNLSTSVGDEAIVIDGSTTNFYAGLDIANCNSGVVIVNEAGKTGIHIVGQNSTDYGIVLKNHSVGIDLNAGALGIKLYSGTDGMTIGSGGGFTGTGLDISQCDTMGLNISSNCVHQLRLVPLSGNPAAPLEGEIAVVDVGATSAIRFYDGAAWKTVTVS